jgi:hypothetical protein
MDFNAAYTVWVETRPAIDPIDDETVKEAILKDLHLTSTMSVEEYTLYKKWCEIKEKYPFKRRNTLFGAEDQIANSDQFLEILQAKNDIWIPKDPMDFQKLEPTLVLCDDDKSVKRWNTIRNFTSTMKNNQNIGRNLFYLVKDAISGKVLGITCMSSDFLDLTPRDKTIGWDRERKTKRMINHTTIGSTIVPTQPLGYNYVGGKLLALLCCSRTVENDWKERYGDVLVGITTTSLYGQSKAGGLSQYDNLKHWKKMGYTSGSVVYETSKETRQLMLRWLEFNFPKEYYGWYIAKNADGQPLKRDHRNRSFQFIYKKLNIPKNLISTAHARGIYFSPLFQNTYQFLREEIKENQLVRAFDNTESKMADLWKTKYAPKRIESLLKNNRVSKETLFYDDLVFTSWNEAKERHLSVVGR